MNKLIYILFIQILSISANAQSILDRGDVAFVGVNSDGNEDKFAFVLLVDIENGSSIHFTDNGWTELDAFNSDYPESHFTWTANQDITKGTIVVVSTFNGVIDASASIGNISGDMMTLSVAGDQVLAYQGDKTSPYFIAAINYNHNINGIPGADFDGYSNSNSTTSMPIGLVLGESAIHIYNVLDEIEADNSVYNFSVVEGTKAELLAAINNVSNWSFNNDVPFTNDLNNQSFILNIPTGIKKTNEDDIQVYPNPASSNIYISSKSSAQIELFDSSGKLMESFQYTIADGAYPYSTNHLPRGIYFLKAFIDGECITKKITISN